MMNIHFGGAGLDSESVHVPESESECESIVTNLTQQLPLEHPLESDAITAIGQHASEIAE